DMIMLKDNHIDFCGNITKAIQTTKSYLDEKNLDLKIIVEARNLDEIAEILENEGIYRILIDNFNYEDTRKAVAMIGEKCLTESSGGITLETA
ncbi:MAG TPA: nicotinate-nucleotide diphosphorylase (carboxylating), partial [Flavobacteriaceae bacterium]|nr:nicotinate-nucleotide diphosphorylase (carboxylating) [Flavobacteriaceae bacterium]